MFILLSRASDYLRKYFILCNNIGFFSATKLFFYLRFRRNLTNLYFKFCNRSFYFRSNADIGVISHFWNKLFVIESSNSDLNIIDAGANIGDETLRFRYFHPKASIVAIEAEKENFEILSLNFQNEKKTSLYHKALWTEIKDLYLMNRSKSNESYFVGENDNDTQSTRVQTITIDEIMRLNRWDRIDILKLDIEGAESQLFSKNYDAWLSKVNVLIFEIPDYDSPGATQRIFSAINSLNLSFNCCRCDELLVLIKKDSGFSMRLSEYYAKS